MVDWNAIKTEYITTDTSYRKLGEEYGIHYRTIADRGKLEGWVALRSQLRHDTFTKTFEKLSDKRSDEIARIDVLTDKLLDRIEKAIEELSLQLVKHTEKTKVIEYNNIERPDKPTKETIHEEEKILEIESIVDRSGLKQIASALRDIKEVKMIRSDLDRQEQEARIAALRYKNDMFDDDDSETGVIELTPVQEDDDE